MSKKTDLLSPDDRERRARALEDQARNLREEEISYEFGEESPYANKKSISKNIINISFIIFGIAGIVGSFWSRFDMLKYVEFLRVFAWVWAPLVIMVGSGRAFKNFVNKKYEPKQ